MAPARYDAASHGFAGGDVRRQAGADARVRTLAVDLFSLAAPIADQQRYIRETGHMERNLEGVRDRCVRRHRFRRCKMQEWLTHCV